MIYWFLPSFSNGRDFRDDFSYIDVSLQLWTLSNYQTTLSTRQNSSFTLLTMKCFSSSLQYHPFWIRLSVFILQFNHCKKPDFMNGKNVSLRRLKWGPSYELNRTQMGTGWNSGTWFNYFSLFIKSCPSLVFIKHSFDL